MSSSGPWRKHVERLRRATHIERPLRVKHVKRFPIPMGVAVAVVLVVTVLFVLPGPARSPSHHPAAPGPPLPTALPTDPAQCSQGAHEISVSPSTPNLSAVLVSDYNELGALGGGTIELGAGTYVLYEELEFAKYSNVSIQGTGIGRTILSMPPNPVGRFTADNGTPLGLWNYTLGTAVNGSVVNFIAVRGAAPINNFEMCALTLRAEANNASEDWDGSLLIDSSGGRHHVYSDIAEAGFFGPSTIPNGIHLQGFANGSSGSDYVVDDLSASNNSLPFEVYPGVRGGANFLNVGASVVDCVIANVTAIGLFALEVAPPSGCVFENTAIDGHLLIDPLVGGSWGGTVFENVTIDSNSTAAPNAMGASIYGDSGQSNFTGMRWVDDTFVGTVLFGENLDDVENSTFYGGLNATPAIFRGNTVVWTDTSPNRLLLPIRIDGSTTGGGSSVLTNDAFAFPNGTAQFPGTRELEDPFLLTVPTDVWWNDTLEIGGSTTGAVLSAPYLDLAANSSFSALTYRPLGGSSPATLNLLDLVGSPGFIDLGAEVTDLRLISDNL